MSPYSQTRKRFSVEPISRRVRGDHWEELIVEDRRSTPAEVAACRLDFREWLARLNTRTRAIPMDLALGEPAIEVARRFRLRKPRVSQIRAESRQSWAMFHGELSG